MFGRLGALVAVLALVASACAEDTTTTTTGGTAGGGPQTVTVNVDWDEDDPNTAFFAYFPRQVKVHAGDTVQFKINDTGEPHTVTFGTKLNEALALAAQYPPPAEPPRAVGKQIDQLTEGFPGLLPEGPGDANQTAAQPCFLATGEPPEDGGCPAEQQQQVDFDGTYSFYNSGWLEAESTFSMTVAASAQPGNYGYFCLLHELGMTGEVEVVAAGQPSQTAADVEAAAQAQADPVIAKLQAAVDATQLPEGEVAAGVGSQEVFDGLASVFHPEEVSIEAGGSVSWTVFAPHTISFNAPQDATPVLSKAPDGSVHINEKAVGSAQTEGVPPPEGPHGPPPEGPPPTDDTDLGSWNGEGFWSTGLILSFPPVLSRVTLEFETAGTYEYQCLVHPDMEGTVTVA